MKNKFSKIYFKTLASFGKVLLKINVKNKQFSIFSNDCYGGEVYRWMQLEYNTPFVGLMLMAPCYVKFLENPHFYFEQPLMFTDKSRYEKINTFRKDKGCYPIGLIDDIEIHFLHYATATEASEKWSRRKTRVNWDNLLIKFSMDKDYATEQLLEKFAGLNYKRKLSISKNKYDWFAANIVIKKYSDDAVIAFRNSLIEFNLTGWLNGDDLVNRTFLQKLLGRVLYIAFQR